MESKRGELEEVYKRGELKGAFFLQAYREERDAMNGYQMTADSYRTLLERERKTTITTTKITPLSENYY